MTLNEHYQQQCADEPAAQDDMEQLGSELSGVDVNEKKITVEDLCDYNDERGFALQIPSTRTQPVTWLALCCPVYEWSPVFSKYVADRSCSPHLTR